MNKLPNDGFLRIWQIINMPAVKARAKTATRSGRAARPATTGLIPVGPSTWWAGVRSGRYPQPTRALGDRITAWSVESIRALIQESSQESK